MYSVSPPSPPSPLEIFVGIQASNIWCFSTVSARDFRRDAGLECIVFLHYLRSRFSWGCKLLMYSVSLLSLLEMYVGI